MNTRGSEDQLGAAHRRIRELEAALAKRDREIADLEVKRKCIAGTLIKVQRRNTKLQAAQEQRSGAVAFMKEGSGMWSKEVDVLVLTMANRPAHGAHPSGASRGGNIEPPGQPPTTQHSNAAMIIIFFSHPLTQERPRRLAS